MTQWPESLLRFAASVHWLFFNAILDTSSPFENKTEQRMVETARGRWKKAEEARDMQQLLQAMEEAQESEDMLVLLARRQAESIGDTESREFASFEDFVEVIGFGRRFWEESPEGWEDRLQRAKNHCENPDGGWLEEDDEKWLDIPWRG